MAPQASMPSKDALQRLIDGLQTLILEHFALARAELKSDVRSMGRDLIAGAAGVPALAAGYLILMIAVGYLLALWLPPWAAFGIVALANLGAGGAVTAFGLRKLMLQKPGLPRTGEELKRDKAWLASLKEGTRGNGDGRSPGYALEAGGQAGGGDGRTAPRVARPPSSAAVPGGTAGGTAVSRAPLGPQPEPGATTPPNGTASVQ